MPHVPTYVTPRKCSFIAGGKICNNLVSVQVFVVLTERDLLQKQSKSFPKTCFYNCYMQLSATYYIYDCPYSSALARKAQFGSTVRVVDANNYNVVIALVLTRIKDF